MAGVGLLLVGDFLNGLAMTMAIDWSSPYDDVPYLVADALIVAAALTCRRRAWTSAPRRHRRRSPRVA